MCIKGIPGEILIFHDDKFIEGNTDYAYNIFMEHKGLGYFHNNFDTIDQEGKIAYNKNYKTSRFTSLYIKNSDKSPYLNKKIRLLNHIRSDFNSSSISISKSIFSGFDEKFEFNVRPDTFLLLVALLSNYCLFFDNKVLTHYRLYGDNVSTSYNTSISRMRGTFIKAFSDGTDIFLYYSALLKNTPYNNYLRLRIVNLELAYNFWALERKYKISRAELKLILRVDFVHELGYYIISILPNCPKG